MFGVVSADGSVEETFDTSSIEALEQELSLAYPKHTSFTFDGDVSLAQDEDSSRKQNPQDFPQVRDLKQPQIGKEQVFRNLPEGFPRRVDDDLVMRMSDEAAFKKLKPFFSSTEYTSASAIARKLFSSTGKHEHGHELVRQGLLPPSVGVGLMLMPYGLYNLRYDMVQAMRKRGGRRPLPMIEMTKLGLCAGSTAECRESCLVFSGSNERDAATFSGPINAKAEKTAALLLEPEAFLHVLWKGILYQINKARGAGLKLYLRLNNFSDLPWEFLWPEALMRLSSAPLRDHVKLYDYTKIDGRDPLRSDYDLTFSYAPVTGPRARLWWMRGGRIAVVFVLKKNVPLTELSFDGHPVLDGTAHDFRPLDPKPSVVGLRWIPPTSAGSRVQKSEKFVVFIEPLPGRKDVYMTAATPRVLPGAMESADAA